MALQPLLVFAAAFAPVHIGAAARCAAMGELERSAAAAHQPVVALY
jgi:hypothetical protein